MRTQQEILDRIEERREEDIFGHECGDYMEFLDFEHVKENLNDGVTKEEWDEAKQTNTREAILKIMKDYMPFAWGKANNERGLSAERSICHYKAWVWLLGDESELSDLWESYGSYGKPQLSLLCGHYGWSDDDDD